MNMALNEKLYFNYRVIFTVFVTLLVWTNLIWDYFHDGVVTHHFLHREDLPGVSNWWGIITIPLFTWLLVSQIVKSVNITSETNKFNYAVYGFVGALLFGITLSIFFIIGSKFPQNMMIGAFVLSFFIPLYKAEILLGFIIGMTYTFGGVLPILIGLVLIILFTFTYKIIRFGVIYLITKIGLKKIDNS